MIATDAHVAVIDDVKGQAETAAGIVEEAGLIPWIVSEGDGLFEQTGQLIEMVRDNGCSMIICDHRLSQTQFASFSGAAFVAKSYEEGIPGLLLSTFSSIDDDTSIRLYRAHIPSVISKGDLDPDVVLDGLQMCASEIAGEIRPERRASRTLVRIINVSMESQIPVVDAIVHTWDPGKAIRFPVDLIENERIREMLTFDFAGELRLFAEVNVGCSEDSGLFFRSFTMGDA